MKLTLPQLFAYFELNNTLDRIEQADTLYITAVGAQCDGDTIKQAINDLGAI
jgi:hypothetical protein